ncbi:unnamed protein product [Rangifer tarandus platyrhynchus]|uniref:Uncharacterized protein n=1 Tax=Rangifer tarandus platyrhynchus TaxID=3082113 RepID=A0AC60A3H6_RANTA
MSWPQLSPGRGKRARCHESTEASSGQPHAGHQNLLPKGEWWDLAARCSKANKQATLVERKVCFTSDAGNMMGRVVNICPKARPPLHPNKQGVRAFMDRLESRGQRIETAQSSLTVIFKLIISGLNSIILVVLGTVNLQF